uniref:T9SS type A sorting domain-containing protein n=1 Tax=Winogradskyella aurantiaca TaxID=2219558 RepID=UPI0037422AC5
METSLDEVIEIRVYDMYGKQVYYSSFEPGDTYEFGKLLDAGVYIVKVSQAGQVRTIKLTRM